MDINRVQLVEKIVHCHKTVGSLLEEYGCLLLKSTATAGDSDLSVKQSPLVDDTNKQLMDIDLAMESIQQQVQLALQPYLRTQSALPTSQDGSTIQSDANQMEIAKVTSNQQVELFDVNNGQIGVKLNTTALEPHALFNGTLPDDFYLHLISVMGIQECLLSNRLVCSFWNELVLERCHNQKSLKLFETFKSLMEYIELLLKYEKTEDTSLILKSIGDDLLFEGLETDHWQLVDNINPEVILVREKKREASKILTDLFPMVEDLVLCTESETFINVEHLLQFYAEQLTSLTMTYFGSYSESRGSKLRTFNFPKLKSLNAVWCCPQDDQLLSLLPQLESLTMDSTKISLEALLRTGTQLQDLNINCSYSVYTAPVSEFSRRPPINSNLRKFTFGHLEHVSQELEFISQNMSSLECLKLGLRFDKDNVSDLNLLTSSLVLLTQLHSLTLEVPVSFFLLDDTQLAEIKPLFSVRHLKLLLWDYYSLPPESMDLFSRALFTAFPNAEQALIAFVGKEDLGDFVDDGEVDTDTLAAFEDFAGKHSNIVQLFRSTDMSKFTNLPNAVSPLLGHHRQVYEEYLEEEELFGVAICKLTACLVTQEGEDVPNLKILLRPADRLASLSNLCQLLESKAFTLTFKVAKSMKEHMIECALEYGPSEGALYIATCKCILSLLDCSVIDEYDSDKEAPFINTYFCQMYAFGMLLNLAKHSMTQQFDDKNLLLQLYKCIGKLMKFDSFRDDENFDDIQMFKVLLQMASYYKTQELNVLDNDEEQLLQIRALIDDQLQMLDYERFGKVLIKFIRSKNRVYRVEMARALLRCCESTNDCFEWSSSEGDSDSSDSTTSDSSSSSEESEPEL